MRGRSAKPPCSNTGAQNTGLREVVQSFVDAVGLTFHCAGSDLEAVVRETKGLFGDSERWVQCGGRFGYTHGSCQDGVVVWWNPERPVMGCHVSAMGGGCRAIATRPGFPGWQDWMKNMLRWEGARFSRLDVAIDDAAGPFASLPGVRSMYEELVAGNAVHRAELRNVSLISNAAGAGDTLYVGSRQSGTYVRAYDKGLERGLDAAANWVRVEVELKGRRAHAMAAAMAEWGFTCVGGVLRSALDFKVAQPDRNKSRWPTAGWWLSFLGQAEKVCLAVAEPLRSIERSVWHLREQYGPTLAALMYAARGDVEWLGTLACQGLARVKPHHRRMVSEFRAKGGDFDRLVAAVA